MPPSLALTASTLPAPTGPTRRGAGGDSVGATTIPPPTAHSPATVGSAAHAADPATSRDDLAAYLLGADTTLAAAAGANPQCSPEALAAYCATAQRDPAVLAAVAGNAATPQRALGDLAEWVESLEYSPQWRTYGGTLMALAANPATPSAALTRRRRAGRSSGALDGSCARAGPGRGRCCRAGVRR